MRSLKPPQLIRELDRKNQSMKIIVIQPLLSGDISTEKVTKFKLDMNQFSVVDRVEFFKQASELICSNLINVSITKEKLQRDYKR